MESLTEFITLEETKKKWQKITWIAFQDLTIQELITSLTFNNSEGENNSKKKFL